ncbi:MAG: hypothetical protein HYY56_05760 [Candidatus Omnitrophica bacterium]|nr:hypothetical protein [Candidatus Omnitrophota bacterium]
MVTTPTIVAAFGLFFNAACVAGFNIPGGTKIVTNASAGQVSALNFNADTIERLSKALKVKPSKLLEF